MWRSAPNESLHHLCGCFLDWTASIGLPVFLLPLGRLPGSGAGLRLECPAARPARLPCGRCLACLLYVASVLLGDFGLKGGRLLDGVYQKGSGDFPHPREALKPEGEFFDRLNPWIGQGGVQKIKRLDVDE